MIVLDLGLRHLARRIATLAETVARAKKSSADGRKRLMNEAEKVLIEAYIAGLDQALIVVRGNDAATSVIVARKFEIQASIKQE